jgi:NAD(P)-dependent dehydrogenase (short-subunit alcohol dehydrogenase family)
MEQDQDPVTLGETSPTARAERQDVHNTPGQRRCILITGCSSGIGYCVAQGLARRGFRVFASARKPQDVARLAAEGLESVVLDLDDSSSIAQAVEQVIERSGGKLYGLFNNAGFGQPGAVEDLRRDIIRAQFETNLFGLLELTNQIIPLMRSAGEGRIIQNSSVLGFVALPFRGAYNASKHALEGLTDTLRMELMNSGIRVALIEPGPISSQFRRNALTAFKQNISIERSVYRSQYTGALRRLASEGPAVPFTLPPEAVLNKVIHALESPNPRARYYVTLPTHVFAMLRRILPTRWLDRILLRIGRAESRH